MKHILTAASLTATLAGILLRALADGCERVSDSLIAQQVHAPETVPDWMSEDVQ